MNYLHKKDYGRAVSVALSLDQPYRVLHLLKGMSQLIIIYLKADYCLRVQNFTIFIISTFGWYHRYYTNRDWRLSQLTPSHACNPSLPGLWRYFKLDT